MVHMVSEEAQLPESQKLLDVKRVGGGNFVRYRPVFSTDTSTIFVTKGTVIESYNVKTGAHVQNYTGLESPAIGVQMHPTDGSLLVACSEEGELITWTIDSQLPGNIVKLCKPPNVEKLKFRGFQLILTDRLDGEEDLQVFTTLSIDPTTNPVPLIFSSTSGSVVKDDLDFILDTHSHSFSFGGPKRHRFLATICENYLTVGLTSNVRQIYSHQVNLPKRFTCVSCHPTEDMVVAGLSLGKILIWSSFTNRKVGPRFCHWHHLPVQDIVFSDSGAHFYSGAEECVLVKWSLDNLTQPQFVPRLSAPIAHISLGPDNSVVAVSTVDNAITFVSSLMDIVSTIQNITWCVMTGLNVPPLAAGLHVMPRDGSLVFNGRVGHLQFYDPISKSMDYNLDITCQNYLTQELDRVVVNTTVVAMAISEDSKWFATVEERHDDEAMFESRIKFWMFGDSEQSFTLNTTVERPHDGSTTFVQFQPVQADARHLAATIGTDRKFRVWTVKPVNTPGMPVSQMWCCESVGFYKSLHAGAMAFSEDGSLLAVSFGSTLTVWTPVTCVTKCSLTHPKTRSIIRHLEFGRKEACHLVATASDTNLCIWNLLSLSMAWTVDLGVALLVSDPMSSTMAVFTCDNELFVFSPLSSRPIYRHSGVAEFGASVLRAVFRPRRGGALPEAGWQATSQLFFITENQDMLSIVDPQVEVDETKLKAMKPSSSVRLTPFSALMARHTESEVKKLMPVEHTQHGDLGQMAIKEFLAAPCHTMPALSLLCRTFLQSFLTSTDSYKEDENPKNNHGMDVDDDENVKNLGDKLQETHVSDADPEVLDKQLDLILSEDLSWVDKYGLNV